MIRTVIALVIIALLYSTAALAQQPRPGSRPPTPPSDGSNPDRALQDINLPEEMRTRMIIERREGEHKKFVEDVKKLYELSSEISRSYNEQQLLSDEDLKKLDNIEKRARRILSYAGGSQVDDKKNEAAQMPVGEAIDKMGVAIAGIQKIVLTESRHVVSAAVIGNSNEVIELTRVIRRSQKQKN